MRRRRPTATDRGRSLAGVAASMVLIAGAAMVGDSAPAQPAEPEGRPDGAAVLDRFLDEVDTLEADFEQELRTADDRLVETASGSLKLRRPNQFRWEYAEPYEQLLIADGENVWIYDVELAQVTVTPMDEAVTSSPAMLLSGDRAVRDGFTVVESFAADGLDWVRLTPQLAATDFKSVLIGFDGTAPRRLELVDGLQQVTRIELTHVAVNSSVDQDAFRFDPPPDVDVIGSAE